MEQITLYYREGSSDKVYQTCIEPKDGGYVVNFAYGRRGATLSTGTKTAEPVDYTTAKRIYDRLVAEKTAKGYTPGADGTPYRHTDREGRSTRIYCQLLNPVDKGQLESLLQNPDFWLQEKHDGRRLLIHKQGSEIIGINRLGLTVGLPYSLVEAARAIPADFIIDGEAVGDILHAFDVLSYRGNDLRDRAYRDRYLVLFNLMAFATQNVIKLVDSAYTVTQKRQVFEKLKAGCREGVVFKNVDAPYTAGRPNSGSSQFKFKFHETASFIVSRINAKRSVSLMLFDGDRVVAAGNVTIPANQEVPPVGAVLEVRYAFRESGVIYQPVYQGRREDIPTEECQVSQLKFKPQPAMEAA